MTWNFFSFILVGILTGMKILPIRSIQSGVSHALSVLPLVGEYNAVLIPVVYHIIRYVVHLDRSLQVSRDQLPLLPLNILDYILIVNGYRHPISMGILSGIISFYFVFEQYDELDNNLQTDVFMVIFLSALWYHSQGESHVTFFCVRDLVYHLLEGMYYMY